ncbi:hypothetical protein HDV00_009613 [Rhizophlyctis rosea]|nr:hypothetical protein HDV00_009613 [Rhizophlyctis rosea]
MPYPASHFYNRPYDPTASTTTSSMNNSIRRSSLPALREGAVWEQTDMAQDRAANPVEQRQLDNMEMAGNAGWTGNPTGAPHSFPVGPTGSLMADGGGSLGTWTDNPTGAQQSFPVGPTGGLMADGGGSLGTMRDNPTGAQQSFVGGPIGGLMIGGGDGGGSSGTWNNDGLGGLVGGRADIGGVRGLQLNQRRYSTGTQGPSSLYPTSTWNPTAALFSMTPDASESGPFAAAPPRYPSIPKDLFEAPTVHRNGHNRSWEPFQQQQSTSSTRQSQQDLLAALHLLPDERRSTPPFRHTLPRSSSPRDHPYNLHPHPQQPTALDRRPSLMDQGPRHPSPDIRPHSHLRSGSDGSIIPSKTWGGFNFPSHDRPRPQNKLMTPYERSLLMPQGPRDDGPMAFPPPLERKKEWGGDGVGRLGIGDLGLGDGSERNEGFKSAVDDAVKLLWDDNEGRKEKLPGYTTPIPLHRRTDSLPTYTSPTNTAPTTPTTTRPPTWPSTNYPAPILGDLPSDIAVNLENWDAGLGSFLRGAQEGLAMQEEQMAMGEQRRKNEEEEREKRRKVREMMDARGLNPSVFDCRPVHARYFVIKSFTEDDVHKSLKYNIWSSTEIGNRRLNNAFLSSSLPSSSPSSPSRYPIYLFFSVNASGHFCGVAEMTTKVDYDRSSSVWSDEGRWKGVFGVRWIFVKDVPNVVLRGLRVPANENKPVTNSRDTQELPADVGREMLTIFLNYRPRTCLFNDWCWYEEREVELGEGRRRGSVGGSGGEMGKQQ